MSTLDHPDANRRKLRFGQLVSVLGIALGSGLLVAGGSFDPSIRLNDLPDRFPRMVMSPHDADFYFGLSAALKGFGAGFLVLGILSLLIPWVNALVYGRRETRAEAANGPQ